MAIALLPYALTTVARVKSRLQITNTSFDEFFIGCINAASVTVEQIAARRFLRTTYTSELYDGSDEYGTRRDLIVLRNAPVVATPSIRYKSGTNASPSWVDVSVEQFDVDLVSGLVYLDSPLPGGVQNLQIDYVAGYKIDFTNYGAEASHTLPPDITAIVERAVVREFKRRDSEGRSSESFNESSITWNEDLFTKEELAAIRNYRRAIL